MRVDADDFARPCSCGREHHIDVKEILIESGAVKKLEEEMSEGFLKNYISPLLICDTNTSCFAEEEMEDISDRCQVLVLEAEGLHADEHAVEIVENNMDEDIDLILAVGSGTIHDISRFVAHKYKIPFVFSTNCSKCGRIRIHSGSNDMGRGKKDNSLCCPAVCLCRYRYFCETLRGVLRPPVYRI